MYEYYINSARLKEAIAHLVHCEYDEDCIVTIVPSLISEIDLQSRFSIKIANASGVLIDALTIVQRDFQVNLIQTNNDYIAALCMTVLFPDIFTWFPIVNFQMSVRDMMSSKEERCYYKFT